MNPAVDFAIGRQIFWMLILGIVIACISRTVIFEEIFKEPREWCREKSERCGNLFLRKFFYLFTCEYCFSHYVTAAFIIITRYRLLLDDWRGFLLSFFGVVFVANMYMSLFSRLRVDIRSERAAADLRETEKKVKEKHVGVVESKTL